MSNTSAENFRAEPPKIETLPNTTPSSTSGTPA
jgi:hypothetical protein